MPIYEYLCRNKRRRNCGRFELVRPMSKSNDPAHCLNCGKLAERLPSLVAMRPDKLWAGEETAYGYVTSQTQLNNAMKKENHVRIGDRTDLEGFKKLAADGAKSREAKLKRKSRETLIKSLGPSGQGILGSD
jgi:putative FmdB family regulatory protein